MKKLLKSGQWVACLVLSLAVLNLAGCASNHPDRTKAQYKADVQLPDNVKDALKQAPDYKFPGVHVDVYRGTVQLNGFVDTEAQRQAATNLAAHLQGVAKVDNNLTVKRLPG